MHILPKYIFHSEVETLVYLRLSQSLNDLFSDNFPEIEAALANDIVDKECKAIASLLTGLIEEVVDKKMSSLNTRKVGW